MYEGLVTFSELEDMYLRAQEEIKNLSTPLDEPKSCNNGELEIVKEHRNGYKQLLKVNEEELLYAPHTLQDALKEIELLKSSHEDTREALRFANIALGAFEDHPAFNKTVVFSAGGATIL